MVGGRLVLEEEAEAVEAAEEAAEAAAAAAGLPTLSTLLCRRNHFAVAHAAQGTP